MKGTETNDSKHDIHRSKVIHSSRVFLTLLLLGVCMQPYCVQPCLAQKTKKDQGKENAKKGDPRAALKRWDANKDGRLEKSEIPEEHRAKVYGAAKQRGMNTKEPLEIKKLFQKPTDEEKQAKKNAKKAERSERKKAESGVSVKANPKGFGKSARAESTKQAAEEKGDAKKKDKLRAARFAAKSLMFQNDKNKNNRLERSEWSRLKGDPSSADKNKDGSLTMNELTMHLAGYGSREEKPRRRKTTSISSSNDGQRKSYRFLTPHERLPKGLPDWFTDRDTNLDGQLSLKEYAPSLTATKYDKFKQLDLNKDGMLVAKEYLAATE